MRARIAGRVTPSSSQTGGEVLEMIELPVKFSNTTNFTCCQETGNVLVSCERVLCLFQLVNRTHDISRLKFLDFELWPVTLELSFAPLDLAVSEDVVAAVNDSCLHVFRINKGFARPTDWSSSTANSSPRNMAKNKTKREIKTSDDKKERSVSPVRLNELLREVSDGRNNHESKKLANGSLPVLALLPSVKCSMANNPARNLRASPFKPPGSVTMGVAIKEIPINEPWAEQMTTMVESLLQLELGNWDEQLNKEKFTCLLLRPQYKINTHYPSKSESSCPRMRSPAYCNLVAFNCLICTQQEGFMYHFPVYEGEVMSLGKCISEYSFTAPVKHIILEPYLLHAITTTGLETYTLRTVHAIEEDSNEETCPPVEEPISLIGIKPFMGVVNLLLSDSYIIILTSSTESAVRGDVNELTLYCLRLPSPGTLYTDFLAIGSTHKFTNPVTYCEMLTEAHSLLRSLTHVHSDPDYSPLQMEVELFRESCALVAEYYLSCDNEDDWTMGYKFSLEAQLNPTQFMDRLKKLDIEAKRVGIELNLTCGLIHYLKLCLTASDEEDKIPVGALNTLLDLIESKRDNSKPFLLSILILESSVLRQFSTERTIRMISQRIQDSKVTDSFDCLALAVLYITKGRADKAGAALGLSNENDVLIELLQKNWTLLFENTRQKIKVSSDDWEGVTLSELSVLLIDKKPRELAEVLSSLVLKSCVLNLQDVLQVFLTYLPARMGTGGTLLGKVLQDFLESVFHGWYTINSDWKPDQNEGQDVEGLKILMRSYLSNIVKPEKSSEVMCPENLFGAKRPHVLDLLPPFSQMDCNRSHHVSLLKLQCLLCSGWLEESSLSELTQFVGEYMPEDIGFSLLVLANPSKGVEMMVDKYPNLLPQFAKDMLLSEPELKHLIATIQTKIDEEQESYKEEDPESRLYTNVLEEVLNNLARTLSCEEFTKILPPGKEFEGYILKCQQTAHACHLKDMIMVTGHRLMATMNLKSFT
ncbi:uncharacterized protein LOC106674330 isoform X2 [Cimex lectularius]|nr:uncharacterized protein LOC106674330 isoform X2 [Cimex lectularius]